jgi:hypothetical protein
MPTTNSSFARSLSYESRSARDSRDLQSHSRAVSPTVSNYFGLAREPPSTGPANIFSRVRKHSSGEAGGQGFWRTPSLSYSYPFFGLNSDHSDDNSEAENEIDGASSDGPLDETDDVDDTDDEDDDDEVDTFEILGHR